MLPGMSGELTMMMMVMVVMVVVVMMVMMVMVMMVVGVVVIVMVVVVATMLLGMSGGQQIMMKNMEMVLMILQAHSSFPQLSITITLFTELWLAALTTHGRPLLQV